MPEPPASNRSSGPPDMTAIGMIGLGLMGAAMAERVMAAGRHVVGYDPDAARCEALREAGASVAKSAQAVAEQCRAIVIAVYSAAEVETTLPHLTAAADGSASVVLCTTTCGPDDILRIAACATASGVGFVEMPVSGTSAEVRVGTASCLLAGDETTLSSVRDIIDILFPRSVVVGQVGDASRTKLAINLILQGNRAALAEGIVLAERMGLNGHAFLCAARASAAYSSVMDTKGEKMLEQDYRPQSRIFQTLKDAELIFQQAAQHDLPLPLMTAQAALLRRAILLCGADSDSAAVIEAIRQPANAGDIR
ncbi:NAD(P)-dependent oxidoreductase [Tardiphaga sp.]|uniref:NAD(P)-dependent oxidoreductase n=1 Tax=Tardiphaga sp. TaxID=1926292 RepID=UPI002635E3D1|nr:NAD(P)-dependent oxidoreductase [Tardiphaga sp.]